MDLYERLGIDATEPKNRSAIDMERQRRSLMRELVEIRKDRGLNLIDVAKELQISHQAVARIEAGNRDARLSTITRYALAVGAHVNMEVKRLEDRYDPPELSEIVVALSSFTVPLMRLNRSGAKFDRQRTNYRDAGTGKSVQMKIDA